MKNNPHLITYADEQFTIDVLGGVDVLQIEKMITFATTLMPQNVGV